MLAQSRTAPFIGKIPVVPAETSEKELGEEPIAGEAATVT
jgi:hypothetical protein